MIKQSFAISPFVGVSSEIRAEIYVFRHCPHKTKGSLPLKYDRYAYGV